MLIKNIKQEKFRAIQNFLNLNIISNKIILAGGSLRTLVNQQDKVIDFDLFFLGEDIKEIKDILEGKILYLGGKKTFQCKEDELRSFEFCGMKIQFISLKGKKYNNAEELLDSFDINASRFALSSDGLYCYRESIGDIRHKHISIHKVSYPVATIKRIAKYHLKGYKITNAALEVTKQIAENGNEMDLELVYVD